MLNALAKKNSTRNEGRPDGAPRYERTSAALGGQYRRFFGASIAATLLLQVTIVTDTIIVGQLLGPVPMSGVRVAIPIVNLLNVIAMLIGVGGSTLVAILIGRRNREGADLAFTLSIVASIVFGAVFALLVAPLSDTLAALISSDPTTLPYTAPFLRIVAVASPVYILASVMALLLRADSCISLSSVVLAAAGVANVAFDLLFMGALGMGVEGSALATDMGMLTAVLLSLLYFRWPKRTLHLRAVFGRPTSSSADTTPGATPGQATATVSQRPSGLTKGMLGPVLKNGLPSATRLLFACIALLFLNFVVGNSVGVEGIAFLTVCGNIQLLAVAFFSAGGQAAIPMQGVLYGEGDYNGLRLLMGSVFRLVLVCVAVLVALVWLFPSQIMSMFVPGGLESDDWLLRLYAVGFLPLAMNYVMTYYYNTIQQRKAAMTLTICENLVIYVPLIWILTNAFGLIGAVLAFVLAETLSALVLLVVALRLKRKLGVDNVLLIPEVPREVVYEATVPVTNADAAGIAHSVKGVLDACGVEPSVSLRSAMGVEELVSNAAVSEHNAGRNVLFDVIVSDLPTCVQVSLRDNGAPFDPTNPDVKNDQIETMLAVVSRVQYNQSLGMNQTIIEVEKKAVS